MHHGPQALEPHGNQYLVDGLEPSVHRPRAQTRTIGDTPRRNAIDAELVEHPNSGVENTLVVLRNCSSLRTVPVHGGDLGTRILLRGSSRCTRPPNDRGLPGERCTYDDGVDDKTPVLAVQGTILQTPTPNALEVHSDVVLAVGGEGDILAVEPSGSSAALAITDCAVRTLRLSPSQRLLPGLIDTHIHAPQWPQLGVGLDIPLERWLFEYTFPLESRYADAAFAQSVWDHMVPSLLSYGTTTAVYFCTIHEEATRLLAETCLREGQRAYVGRVAMDHPEGTPEYYRDESAVAGVSASARSIEQIRALDDPLHLVQPIITPRFIPACTDELLRGLGELAARTQALVQTHCSESDWEHGYVIDRHGCSDTESLRRLGLLRRGTVLAHGNHLGDADLVSIASVGAGVAHCPLSNAYFAGAVFPTQRALRLGVQIGLGSDVSGGAHPGLLPQCAMAVTSTRIGEDGVDALLPAAQRGMPDTRIDTVTAFHLATAGGAGLLGAPLGLLEPGRQFDAIVVDLEREHSALRAWDGLDTEDRIFEKIVRLASPADISAVFVAGRRVR